MNDIITNIQEKNLNTLLKIHLSGNGEEIFEYNLPFPHSYNRIDDNNYSIEYRLKGVFWTKKSVEYLNDIILRFHLSMNISLVETKVIKTKKEALDLKYFKELKSLSSVVKTPESEKYKDSVFWGIKLYVESFLQKNNTNFMPYETIFSFAKTHYIDHVDHLSTLKAKAKSIWNYYNEKGWKPQLVYIKKNKEEVMATRLKHIEDLAKQKKLKTKILIESAIKFLATENKKITNKEIAKFTNLHINTLTKYKDHIKDLKAKYVKK